jgi:hypothetical protein
MYSNAMILTIFVFALIAVVEVPNIFENVFAQQSESSQQGASSSRDVDRTSEGTSEPRSSADRIPDDVSRSSADRSSQDSNEVLDRDVDRTPSNSDSTSAEDVDRTPSESDSTSAEVE